MTGHDPRITCEAGGMRPAAPGQQTTVLLVRHGVAVEREDWSGDDHDRPLTPLGLAQSVSLVRVFRTYGAVGVISSTLRRCRDTITHGAAVLGLPIAFDERLNEPEHRLALPVLTELSGGTIVVCSRGETIRGMLRVLQGRRAEPGGPVVCERGSVWVLRRRATGNLDSVEYRPPSPLLAGSTRR